MLDAVLIANRGEIAVRIARTVRALGMTAVAVYSDADAGAPHVHAADVAVRIGPAAASESYLSVAAVVDAARRTGAGAVHPGYGFLSENADLARACAEAGIAFVGPPPEAIEAMGDKARAKALAREAGVPVVPGVEGADLDVAEVEAFAAESGLPLIVKAVAGGGGKGMRVVREAGELADAVAAARREGTAAFGDGRLLVERYLERPRHIEIQVLADRHGGCVHLGERECSLQRRHQKVVEEAPSPVVGPDLRERMGAAAVALARACGYEGAGTVEFVVPADDPEAFAFLEMNTRLQVEHPVTEMTYGVDLVEAQLRIAAGEPLALAQDELRPSGHAVEARVYAEDPAAGFLPATGTVLSWREPAGRGPGGAAGGGARDGARGGETGGSVRVDGGVAVGTVVGTDYDPLLAKAIARGPDRETALARLRRALGELDVLGVATNAGFTRTLLDRDEVRAGALDTGLLERLLGELAIDPAEDLLPAGALALLLAERDAAAADTTVPFGWPDGGWRRAFEQGVVAVRGTPEACEVTADHRTWAAAVEHAPDGGVRVALDGISRRYAVAGAPAAAGAEAAGSADRAPGDDVRRGAAPPALWIGRDGFQLELRPVASVRSQAATLDSLEAPMPGTVLMVEVANGDRVSAGDTLLVLESMKMELAVAAPHDGVVADLELAVGDRVSQRQPLVSVHA